MNHCLNTSFNHSVPGIAIIVLLALASFAHGTPQEVAENTVEIEGAIVKNIDRANVPAEIQGVLSTIAFREGQRVQKGELLARIKSKSLSLELKQAQAKQRISKVKAENQIDIQFAQKSAEVSSAKLNRSRSSNQRAPGVVSRGRLQELELEVHRDRLRIEQATKSMETAKMELELAQTDVEMSENAIEKANIVSPISGVVVLVEKNEGEWVEPGETVLKIVRLDRLRLEGFVPAAQAGQIEVGDAARVIFEQDWLTEKEIEGKVVFLNPEANPVNAQVEIWVEIDNPNQKLMPGLEARVVITFSSQDP